MAELDEDMRKFIRETLKEEAESKKPVEVCPLMSLLSNKELREGLNEFRASVGLETPVEMTPAFQEIQAAHSEVKAPSAAGSAGESSSSYGSSSEEESEEEVKKQPPKKAPAAKKVPFASQKKAVVDQKKAVADQKKPVVDQKKAIPAGPSDGPPDKKRKYHGRSRLDKEEPLTAEQEEKERKERMAKARVIIDLNREVDRLGKKIAPALRREICWPKVDSLSRFHVDEQKNIVECLKAFPNGRRPARFMSKEEEYLWSNFETLVLGDKMALELQEARAEFQEAANNDIQNYKFLSKPIRQFVNSRLYRRRLRLRPYPQMYRKMGVLSWPEDQRMESATSSQILSFEELVAEMGFVPDIKIPVVEASTQLRTSKEEQLEKLFPPADSVKDNAMFASNQPVSRDKNIPVIVPRYKPDVVMSSSAFKALLTIDRSTTLSDIPVVVVEKQGLKVVFIDKPMPPKRQTGLDRRAKWFKFCVKEFLCQYPSAERESRKDAQGKKPATPLSKTEKNRMKKQNRKAKSGQQGNQSMESPHDGGESAEEVEAALGFCDYEPVSRPSLEKMASPPTSPFGSPPMGASRPNAPPARPSRGGSAVPGLQGQGHAASPKHSPPKQSPEVVVQASAAGPSQALGSTESPRIPSVFDVILSAQTQLFPEPAWKKAVGFRGSQEAPVADVRAAKEATGRNAVFRTSAELFGVKDRLHKPPGRHRNVTYRLWSLGQGGRGNSLKVIIRTSDDGQKMDERTGRSSRCIVTSKMEFQYLYGYEFPSWNEAASNWADLCLRPGATLVRVHHSPRFGLVYSIEEKDLNQVTHEGLNPMVEFDPAAALKKVDHILRQLVALDVGTYMLKTEIPGGSDLPPGAPTHGQNTVYICREAHEVLEQNDPSLYLFRRDNEAIKFSLDADFLHSPWRPTNPRILTPLAITHGKAPGILWPTRIGFTKDGILKYGKQRKERRKERKKEKVAMKTNAQQKDVSGVKVVDMSKGFR